MTWLTFKNGVIVEGWIPGTWAGSSSRSGEETTHDFSVGDNIVTASLEVLT